MDGVLDAVMKTVSCAVIDTVDTLFVRSFTYTGGAYAQPCFGAFSVLKNPPQKVNNNLLITLIY